MQVVAAGHRGSRPDLVHEPVEQIQRVVRSGSRLGVVLDGRALHVPERQPLDGAVVQVDVGQLGGAEVGLPAHRLVAVDRPGAARAEHGEAVVLARDLGTAGRQVLDRMVGAVVAERELVGLEADGAAQQLVPEADAVHRTLADELADGVDDVVERRRVTGTVGEEDRVGVVGDQLRGARRARMQLDRGAALAQVADDRELDARVDHRDPRPLAVALEHRSAPAGVTSLARSRPVIGGSAAISSRACASAIARREHAAAHRSLVADVADERPRVEIGDRRDPAVGRATMSQPRFGAGRVLAVDRGAHDRGARVDAVGLHRLRRDAVVADLRVGERDQLAGVARIGHRLLVAGHRGREHDLADRVRVGAAGEPVEAGPVLEQDVGACSSRS